MTGRSGVLAGCLIVAISLVGCMPGVLESLQTENRRPVASIAAPGSAAAGQTIVLDGSGSTDPDGDTLRYAWVQVVGPNVVLADANQATASFEVPTVSSDMIASFQLVVTDPAGLQDTASVSVTFSPATVPEPLEAMAGPDLQVISLSQAPLSGGSTGGVGTLRAYMWSTEALTATINEPNQPTTSFSVPAVDERTEIPFTLTVVDEAGQTSTDQLIATVHVPRVRFNMTQGGAPLGEFVVQLNPVKAPQGAPNFLGYVSSGFYDGLVFHRTIPELDPEHTYAIIQGGGFDPALVEKTPGDPIPLESNNNWSNLRGTVAYARTFEPDSATSQFFINVSDNPGFDWAGDSNPGYAVFAEVVEGMDVVDAISQVPTQDLSAAYGGSAAFKRVPVPPVVIESATIEPAGSY